MGHKARSCLVPRPLPLYFATRSICFGIDREGLGKSFSGSNSITSPSLFPCHLKYLILYTSKLSKSCSKVAKNVKMLLLES